MLRNQRGDERGRHGGPAPRFGSGSGRPEHVSPAAARGRRRGPAAFLPAPTPGGMAQAEPRLRGRQTAPCSPACFSRIPAAIFAARPAPIPRTTWRLRRRAARPRPLAERGGAPLPLSCWHWPAGRAEGRLAGASLVSVREASGRAATPGPGSRDGKGARGRFDRRLLSRGDAGQGPVPVARPSRGRRRCDLLE